MGTKLTDTQTVTTTGVKAPATLTKFPEYGATVGVELTGGGSCTVQFRAWANGSESNKEILATFVLPVVGGVKNGDTFDHLPIFSTWDNWDWNVTAIATGTARLSVVGVGV